MKKTTTAAETPVAKAKAEKPTPPKATKKKPAKPVTTESVKSTPEDPIAPEASSITSKTTKSAPDAPIISEATKAPIKKAAPKPKAPKKAPAIESATTAASSDIEPISFASAPETAIQDRIGLTAGSIWHYLAKNGASPVAKLVFELAEEENIIQRSIGWLAQEGKIMLSRGGDQVETIELKG